MALYIVATLEDSLSVTTITRVSASCMICAVNCINLVQVRYKHSQVASCLCQQKLIHSSGAHFLLYDTGFAA